MNAAECKNAPIAAPVAAPIAAERKSVNAASHF